MQICCKIYQILFAHVISDQTSTELKTRQKEVKAHLKSQASVRASLKKLTQKLSQATAKDIEEEEDLEKIRAKLCAVVAQKEKYQASANQRTRQKIAYEKVTLYMISDHKYPPIFSHWSIDLINK